MTQFFFRRIINEKWGKIRRKSKHTEDADDYFQSKTDNDGSPSDKESVGYIARRE